MESEESDWTVWRQLIQCSSLVSQYCIGLKKKEESKLTFNLGQQLQVEPPNKGHLAIHE